MLYIFLLFGTCTFLMTFLLYYTDTRILMVAIEPNKILALSTGRTHANITCTVTLNSDIDLGPKYTALSVSWMTNYTDDTEMQLLTAVSGKKFNRILTIPLTNTGQRIYCCNASLTGKATTVSACSTVETLGDLNFKNIMY